MNDHSRIRLTSGQRCPSVEWLTYPVVSALQVHFQLGCHVPIRQPGRPPLPWPRIISSLLRHFRLVVPLLPGISIEKGMDPYGCGTNAILAGWDMLIRDVRHLHHRRVLDGSFVDELLHPEITPGTPRISYSIAHARVLPGESTLPHRFLQSTEVYFVLEGSGLVHIGDESAILSPGQAVCIPPGSTQWVENTGDGELVFLAIVDPPWTPGGEETVRPGRQTDGRDALQCERPREQAP